MGSVKSSALKVLIRSTMFLLYLFAGSGIFLLIEKSSQEEKRSLAFQNLYEYEGKLKITYNITDIEFDYYKELIEKAINVGATGSKRHLSEWTFSNAFFFCVNVITTIGYGHITPQSIEGRIVMIFYALFGISLTGFFLRTVGNELTTIIAFLIKTYERRVYNREAEKLEIKCAIVSLILVLLMLLLGGGIFSMAEITWTFFDALYFCFVSLTTIGFGDLIPGTAKVDMSAVEEMFLEIAFLIYYVIGLSIMSGVIVALSGVIEEKTKKFDIADPMDAIRNLRIENLNSKAMKKLGYKVDEGIRVPPRMMKNTQSSVNMERRGTIVPDDDERIAISRSRTSLQNGGLSNGIKGNVKSNFRKSSTGLTSPNNIIKNSNNQECLDKRVEPNKNETPVAKSPKTNNLNHTSRTPVKGLENSLQSLIETDESEENINAGDDKLDVDFADPNKGTDNTSGKIYTLNEKLFTLNEESTSSFDKLNTENKRTNSLSDMKLGTNRQVFNSRIVPKDKLRKHSSLKDLKIHYSSNIHSMQRERKSQARVGLPAELFANDVSFVMKNNAPCEESPASNVRLKPPKSDVNGSFYSIPPSTPVRSYTNPYFQSDDVIYSSLVPPTTRSMDLCHTRTDNMAGKTRPNTSDRVNNV